MTTVNKADQTETPPETTPPPDWVKELGALSADEVVRITREVAHVVRIISPQHGSTSDWMGHVERMIVYLQEEAPVDLTQWGEVRALLRDVEQSLKTARRKIAEIDRLAPSWRLKKGSFTHLMGGFKVRELDQLIAWVAEEAGAIKVARTGGADERRKVGQQNRHAIMGATTLYHSWRVTTPSDLRVAKIAATLIHLAWGREVEPEKIKRTVAAVRKSRTTIQGITSSPLSYPLSPVLLELPEERLKELLTDMYRRGTPLGPPLPNSKPEPREERASRIVRIVKNAQNLSSA